MTRHESGVGRGTGKDPWYGAAVPHGTQGKDPSENQAKRDRAEIFPPLPFEVSDSARPACTRAGFASILTAKKKRRTLMDSYSKNGRSGSGPSGG